MRHGSEPMLLPSHPWDDEAHRAVIHAAFDRWAQAHEQGCLTQAHRLQLQLRHLIEGAHWRQLAHLAVGERDQLGT